MYLCILLGAFVEVYCDNEKNFKGLFFQDQQMIDTFKAYPELLCIDATYKLVELRLPVYIMLCEDANGMSEIISICLLVQEDADTMKWMVNAFKKLNLDYQKVRAIMADKDIGEREVLKQCFPNTTVLICLFHTLRSFRREINCEKMGITAGQRNACLELIQKICYAHSEAEYMDLFTQLQSSAPKEVFSYYKDNWHPIRNEWVLGMKSNCGTFLNFTNNRLECINGKLKQVINRYSSLELFIEQFFIILTTLRTERDHKAAIMFQKVKVIPFSENTPEYQYSKLLTSYATQYVLKQMELAKTVKDIIEEDCCFAVQTSEGRKEVSISNCQCIFNSSMHLPCRHIFALRKKLNKPLFCHDFCDPRWTADYYRSTQRIFLQKYSQPTVEVATCSKEHSRKLSQHQKFHKASILTTQLASVASEASNIHFERRYKLLEDLLQAWKDGSEVALRDIELSKFIIHIGYSDNSNLLLFYL